MTGIANDQPLLEDRFHGQFIHNPSHSNYSLLGILMGNIMTIKEMGIPVKRWNVLEVTTERNLVEVTTVIISVAHL
jgi:hypothetical protein